MKPTKPSMGTIQSNEGERESTSSVPLQESRARYAAGATRRERLAESISQALIENGIGPIAPDGMHAWRCEYPDVYGPCECFAETVTDIVDAVMREVS